MVLAKACVEHLGVRDDCARGAYIIGVPFSFLSSSDGYQRTFPDIICLYSCLISFADTVIVQLREIVGVGFGDVRTCV